MKIEAVSAPGLEMRVAFDASSPCFELARGTATVAVHVVSVIALFTEFDDVVAAYGVDLTRRAATGCVGRLALFIKIARGLDNTVTATLALAAIFSHITRLAEPSIRDILLANIVAIEAPLVASITALKDTFVRDI
jgi:hypothetical protein